MLSICSFCELYAIIIASRRSPQHLRLQVITSLSIDNSVWLANLFKPPAVRYFAKNSMRGIGVWYCAGVQTTHDIMIMISQTCADTA